MFKPTGNLSSEDLENFLRGQTPHEISLRELKTRLPDLTNKKERAEFIRDVIAMANAVRRIGRSGYLIYGISEPSIVVDQELAVVYPSTQGVDLQKRMDLNARHLLSTIEAHIEPCVDAEMYFDQIRGPVDAQATGERHTQEDSTEERKDLNHGIVVWLEVRYMHQAPFVVRKGFEYDEIENGERVTKFLRPGSAWTRFGTSKGRELRGDDQSVLVAFKDIPYVSTEYWRSYSDQTRPELPQFYQPVGCTESLRGGGPGSACDHALKYLVDWLDNKQSNLYLEGGIGSGKSTVLRQYHGFLLDRLQMDTDDRKIHEPPQQWIPVRVDVHGESFADATTVADLVLNRIEDSGLSYDSEVGPRHPDWHRKLLESPDLRYVVLFDGLDEMDDSEIDWSRSLGSIRRFCESRRSRMRAILAVRTGYNIWDSSRSGWDRIELNPLRKEQVEDSAKKLLYPEALLQTIFRTPDLSRYVTNPLAMDSLLSFAAELEEECRRAEQAPFYELGQFVHRLVNAILDHESQKDSGQRRYLRRERRISALAKLAWKLDGKDDLAPLTVLEEVFGEEQLEEDDLLRAKQMGILRDRSGSEWEFTSELVKAYFLTRHAIELARSAVFQQPPVVDWDAALKGCTMSSPIWTVAGNLLVSIPLGAEAKRVLQPFMLLTGLNTPVDLS